MEIHILLADVQIGPFSEKQVRQHLEDGMVSTSDLARLDGMKDWASLEKVLAELLPPATVPKAMPVLPESKPEVQSVTKPLKVPPLPKSKAKAKLEEKLTAVILEKPSQPETKPEENPIALILEKP